MAEDILNFPFPDLYELEYKIGRKTPESLLMWMKDAAGCEDTRSSDDSLHFSSSLSEKLSELKQEMTRLRSADVRILRQLVAVHEGIEAIRWVMEERGGVISLLEEDDEEPGLSMSPYRESPSPRSASPQSLSGSIREKPVDQSANCDSSSLFESLEAGPSSLSSSSCEIGVSAREPRVEAPDSAAVSQISDEVAESLKRMPDPARLRNIKTGAETIKKALLRCSKLRKQRKVEKTSLTPVLGKKNVEQQTEEIFDSAAKDRSSASGVDPSLSYKPQWYWMESKDDVTNL